MASTAHGWHIEGSPQFETHSINKIKDCGGPGTCPECTMQAAMYNGAPSAEAMASLPFKTDPTNGPATHGVNLTFFVRNPQEWDDAYNTLGMISRTAGGRFMSHRLESYLIEEEQGVEERTEYFDENTLVKVRRALTSALFPDGFEENKTSTTVELCIAYMQKAGILFRERS